LNSVDTNIFVYSLLPKQAPEKHAVSVNLLKKFDLALSSQVANELGAALRSKHAIRDDELLRILEDIYLRYEVIDLISEDIFSAFELRKQYNFSYWDSLIVATALRSDAERLYTEDMQHGLLVNGQMTIWNPFTHSIL
jgi:predicted nucleic acid-binding protein